MTVMLAMVAVLALSAAPNALPEFERILLPVVTRTPTAGAHGSLWETVLTMRNASDRTVIYFPTDCPLVPSLPSRSCLQNPAPEFPPGVTKRVNLLTSGAVFLNVTKSLADQTFVQLRVHDLSRQAESFGTEIPVVRAAEMKTALGQILDIPRDPRFRLTFRLYADYVTTQSELRVSFVNEATGRARESSFTILPIPPEVPDGEPLTSPALYRQISDFDSYAELEGTERIRIEIEPRTEGMRYWAFVSVTNNETQQITTLTVR